MSRKKHRPARPHWERIASRRANNRNVTIIPEGAYSGGFGTYVFLKEMVRPANSEPGK
jgi:hypothetical protein